MKNLFQKARQAIASSPPPLEESRLNRSDAFTLIKMPRFLGNKIKGDYPLSVMIPSIYRAWDGASDATETVWACKPDWQKIKNGESPGEDYGYFRAKVTPNMQYDSKHGLFFSNGIDEKSFVTEYTDHGYTEVRCKRQDTNGVPILFFEACSPEGTPGKIAYLASRINMHVIMINYARARQWEAVDQKIWKTFTNTLRGRM